MGARSWVPLYEFHGEGAEMLFAQTVYNPYNTETAINADSSSVFRSSKPPPPGGYPSGGSFSYGGYSGGGYDAYGYGAAADPYGGYGGYYGQQGVSGAINGT